MRARIACLLAALLVAGVVAGAAPRALGASVKSPPVTLVGAGSWGVLKHMTEWANAMFDAPSKVTLDYFGRGSRDGRGQFARGEVDFTVSGTPFTAEEKAALKSSKRTYVQVPLAPTALAFLLRPPCCKELEEVQGTGEDATLVPYPGPVRMPGVVIARAIFKTANTWNDPDFKAAMPVQLRSYIRGIEGVARSDPSASNLFLETYLKHEAPDIWAQKVASSDLPSDEPQEDWPFLEIATRAGVDAVISAVASDFSPSQPGATQGGNLGMVPPWAASDVIDRLGSRYFLRVVHIQNANGDWVVPTPASVTRAIESGEGKPLSAMTSKVEGAYPLAWLTYLSAPTKGLQPDKANALATLIRYAVTSGRSVASKLGEAELPDSFVDRGLEAANEVVRGNCTGKDRELVNTTAGGDYSPSKNALSAVGTMLQCLVKIPVLPTVLPPAPGLGGVPAVNLPPLAPGSVGPVAGPLPATGGQPVAGPVAGTTVLSLPYEIAGTKPGRSDTPVTLLIGAILYWRGYTIVVRRRRRRGVAAA